MFALFASHCAHLPKNIYFSKLRFTTMKEYGLADCIKKIESSFPTKYGDSWDNVGLLTEPYETKIIKK